MFLSWDKRMINPRAERCEKCRKFYLQIVRNRESCSVEGGVDHSGDQWAHTQGIVAGFAQKHRLKFKIATDAQSLMKAYCFLNSGWQVNLTLFTQCSTWDLTDARVWLWLRPSNKTLGGLIHLLWGNLRLQTGKRENWIVQRVMTTFLGGSSVSTSRMFWRSNWQDGD